MDMQSKKIAVQNIALPPRVIFEEIARNLERKQAIVPKTEAAFIKSIQRARTKSGKHPKAPSTYGETIDIPDHIPDGRRGRPKIPLMRWVM